MKASEFIINIPINIKINGDGKPEIDMGTDTVEPDDELDQNPVMLSPQQQELELRKSEQGKTSPYIDTMLSDDPEIGDDPEIDAVVPERPRRRTR
tara:strand:+ start:203 stop:487 length:285 start_codon:yes stop_codon:yes gene_type:complete